MTRPAATPPPLTPADQGIIAAARDDARRRGLGDDATTDLVRDALMTEAGFGHAEATALAYRAVHGDGPRRHRTWAPIKRGRTAPTVVAWIEVFWAPTLGRYVTIPGASRFHDGPERPE
jgi:hypothetical protein